MDERSDSVAGAAGVKHDEDREGHTAVMRCHAGDGADCVANKFLRSRLDVISRSLRSRNHDDGVVFDNIPIKVKPT